MTHTKHRPAVINYLAGPASAVDVYSFRVITVEVYTRQPVWQGMSTFQIRQATVERKEYSKSEQECIPEEAQTVIRACFRHLNYGHHLSFCCQNLRHLLVMMKYGEVVVMTFQ